MDRWLEELAAALGVEPLAREETGALLRATREVAHRVERKDAPLAAFLLGTAVGRRAAGPAPRKEALAEVLEQLEATLPEPPSDADGAGVEPGPSIRRE